MHVSFENKVAQDLKPHSTWCFYLLVKYLLAGAIVFITKACPRIKAHAWSLLWCCSPSCWQPTNSCSACSASIYWNTWKQLDDRRDLKWDLKTKNWSERRRTLFQASNIACARFSKNVRKIEACAAGHLLHCIRHRTQRKNFASCTSQEPNFHTWSSMSSSLLLDWDRRQCGRIRSRKMLAIPSPPKDYSHSLVQPPHQHRATPHTSQSHILHRISYHAPLITHLTSHTSKYRIIPHTSFITASVQRKILFMRVKSEGRYTLLLVFCMAE